MRGNLKRATDEMREVRSVLLSGAAYTVDGTHRDQTAMYVPNVPLADVARGTIEALRNEARCLAEICDSLRETLSASNAEVESLRAKNVQLMAYIRWYQSMVTGRPVPFVSHVWSGY